ncbi:serine/threonine protein kinase, CMGC, CDC2/CDK subfamily [Paraconiothyrium brasiliense]|uniref:Serine/threonine protein kinase, CMGC, CDC2/CDK subfamily n=1 Tax=Paraconiothyrium brasiliense TaxID=300254 RepID=A0ABR3RVL7_9PLEO
MATAVAAMPSKGLQRRFKGCSKIGEYELLKKLGEGTFGEVHQARHVRSGRIFAMKKILTHNEKDGFPITALREIKLLKMLSHENVLKLEEMSVERPKAEGRKRAILYMVMPYMDHDLSGLLDNPDVHFSAPQVKCYMLQLFKGLRYLHDNHILHRDMKAANLLINNRGRLQIADFGLARHYDEPVPQPGKGNGEARRDYTTLVVTRWYRPPELLLQLRRYTPAIDMWGAGCVFGEMFKRKPILAGQSDLHQAQIIFELVGSPNDRSMPGWNQLPGAEPVRAFAPSTGQLSQRFRELSPQGLDLLSKLLMLDWRKRINAIDAIDHHYFKEDPRPMREEDIPTFADSHELDRRNARGQKQNLPPAPAGDVMVHPIEGRPELIDHEETTTVGRRRRQDMETAGHIGVVMEQTSLFLLCIRLAMVKVVTVGTATVIVTGALRLEILIFLRTMDRDPERNVDLETLTTGQEMVDVDPVILVTRETALPTIVRTVAGVTGTGTEQEIRATLDEIGAMVGHVHEVQIEETGHASETETFTDGRIAWGKGLICSYTEEAHSSWTLAHTVWEDCFLYNMHGASWSTQWDLALAM